QLGHEAYVLEEGVTAAADWKVSAPDGMVISARIAADLMQGEGAPDAGQSASGPITPEDLAAALSAGTAQVIDLRPSMEYRKGHIPGSIWSIRPRVVEAAERSKTIVLIYDDPFAAAFAALELADVGIRNLRDLAGGLKMWRAAGLPIEATPDVPADRDCIDFL